MKFSKVLIIATVLLFACSGATAARTVLQQPQQQPEQPPQQPEPTPQEPQQTTQEPQELPQDPQQFFNLFEVEETGPEQCQAEWSPERIECTFPCSTGDWEFECDAVQAEFNFATCRLKRAEGANQETLYFYCLIPTPGEPPNCQQGLNTLNTIPDQCVMDFAEQTVGLWPASAAEN